MFDKLHIFAHICTLSVIQWVPLRYIIYFQDVFILDTQKELFVWIGNDTTHDERKNAMIYAHVSKKYCILSGKLTK